MCVEWTFSFFVLCVHVLHDNGPSAQGIVTTEDECGLHHQLEENVFNETVTVTTKKMEILDILFNTGK